MKNAESAERSGSNGRLRSGWFTDLGRSDEFWGFVGGGYFGLKLPHPVDDRARAVPGFDEGVDRQGRIFALSFSRPAAGESYAILRLPFQF